MHEFIPAVLILIFVFSLCLFPMVILGLGNRQFLRSRGPKKTVACKYSYEKNGFGFGDFLGWISCTQRGGDGKLIVKTRDCAVIVDDTLIV